jgi:hypothetical protein
VGQSPIKLVTDTSLRLSCPLDLLTIDYPPGVSFPGTFKGDAAHGNFELTGPPFPLIRFRKRASTGNNWRTFKLVKVHIHKPSEHLVDSDEPAHFEVHFLHVPELGTLDDPKVVIGVLFDVQESAGPRYGLESLGKAMPSRRMLKSQNSQQAVTGWTSLHIIFSHCYRAARTSIW